jgi:aryl-alcohol dehydrogenase-like predicted oxidoreductase
MEKRSFGNTGLEVSRLTFGCGAVGGLMTKGLSGDQDRAVAWARDNGINFFDTAASYGDGVSETNLGRALNGNTDGLVVSSKVGLSLDDLADVEGAVTRSLDASLSRLRLDHVDIFQLHNTIGHPDHRGTLSMDQILGDVIPAFEKLKDAGKTRFLGFTAKGDVGDLHALVKTEQFSSAQIFYNLLVPSAGEAVRADYPAEDFRKLLGAAAEHGVGAIGVRVLAGGALSGSEARNPLGMPVVSPIGSNTDYATDVQRALRFMPLVESGHAASLTELAVRYVISNQTLPTTEIGIANLGELQSAADAVNKGALSAQALAAVRTVQASFS